MIYLGYLTSFSITFEGDPSFAISLPDQASCSGSLANDQDAGRCPGSHEGKWGWLDGVARVDCASTAALPHFSVLGEAALAADLV